MAKDPKQEQMPPPDLEANAEPLGPPKSYRLQISLALVGLILFQMIVLWFLLPSRASVESVIGGANPLDGAVGFGDPSLVPPSIGKDKPKVEIPIPANADPIKAKILRDDGTTETFTSKMSVKVLQTDQKKFEKRYGECAAEVLDQVGQTLRASPTEDLKDPALTSVREKVKRKINDVLETPWVLQVLFPNPEHDIQ